MLFLLEVEVEDPPGVDSRELLELVVAEWEFFQRLEERGKVLGGGKLTGRRGAVAILDVKDAQEMDRIAASLPLFPHFTRVRVTPLVPSADALKNARMLLVGATRKVEG